MREYTHPAPTSIGKPDSDQYALFVAVLVMTAQEVVVKDP